MMERLFTFCLDAKSNKKIKAKANAPPLWLHEGLYRIELA
jgi:hypothetical protein